MFIHDERIIPRFFACVLLLYPDAFCAIRPRHNHCSLLGNVGRRVERRPTPLLQLKRKALFVCLTLSWPMAAALSLMADGSSFSALSTAASEWRREKRDAIVRRQANAGIG